MTTELDTTPRSRRALLTAAATAAAGAAAAMAATAAAPARVLAVDPNDVAKDQDNATTAVTSITQGTADTNAFEANGNGSGVGLVGRTGATTNAAVVGLSGDATQSAYVTKPYDLDAGVYGFAAETSVSSGVWGEGVVGTWGTGDLGVYAEGAATGLYATAYPTGTAIHGHAGAEPPPAELSLIALRGTTSSRTQVGLRAEGRVQFPHRSGKTTIAGGSSQKTITVTGVRSTNYAFAVLNSSRSGIYVRAVVPGTDKITIYLNKAPSSATFVAWQVLG